VTQLSKIRAFLLLRYTLIVSTAYLIIVERHFEQASTEAMLLITAALASNVLIAQLPRRITDSMRFAMVILVCDTLWITAALLISGSFNSEFFFLYFFVLLLAAIGESLRLIAIGACVVCGAYLFGRSATDGTWSMWATPNLIRIPFLFSTAIFYGYLVERTRREGKRADDAEALAAQLDRTLTELRLLHERAQEADRIKTEFLATVSHELRTPLTSLVGYVELLMDQSYGQVSVEQRGALGRVRSASRILQQAISRMLDASRLDFGNEGLTCEEFELNDMFDELRSDLPPPESVALHWPPAENVPPLRTDTEKLRTILRNLVENAFKYTPRGLIMVEAQWDEKADEIEVSVKDTGIGIAASEIDGIFEAFQQAGHREARPTSGVGLGLYIVQRLVARLGGEVRVDSSLGTGSTFSIRVPRLLHRGAAIPAGLPAPISETAAVA
jgi:signal transduction histidine kinase